MELIKTANGKKRIKLSRKEWTKMGRKAGWLSSNTKTSSNEMDVEELVERWKNSEDDIKVNDNGEAFFAGELISSPDETNPDFKAIRQWMEENNYYPAVWVMNDHGNVSLYSIDENGQEHYRGGLV